MISVGADVFESRGIGVVEVDTDNLASVARCSALDIDVPLALRGTLVI